MLVAYEYSGTVRDEFAKLGWNAWSCDLQPSEKGGQHFQCDVAEIIDEDWELLIAHPVCTRLTNSGVRWLYERNLWNDFHAACTAFKFVLNVKTPHVAIENPIPHELAAKAIGQKYTQLIQPWQFGHGETKATCLWLKNLPPLVPTNIVEGREQRIHKMARTPERSKERSRTFPGIANAMAVQWTKYLRPNLNFTYGKE